MTTTGQPAGDRTLLLGETLVDLIAAERGAELSAARSFAPHFGGSVANVAVFASRAGTRVALASGAGDDSWGRWLRDRLASEGVDVSLFAMVPSVQTPVAAVVVDGAGEARYQIYGDSIAAVVAALGDRIVEAVDSSSALFFGSNTLVGPEERAVTMLARSRALELDRPVVFDPNLRLERWRSVADAAASANACVPGALLVRLTAAEATVMTGEDDPERAAAALLAAGARLVVITLGAAGAILRGEHRLDVPGVAVEPMVSTIGAGDALTGTLIARLASTGFYPAAAAACLADAVAAGARACAHWGALD
jgi:sugar/nucleoside kinase (ribokinase family)